MPRDTVGISPAAMARLIVRGSMPRMCAASVRVMRGRVVVRSWAMVVMRVERFMACIWAARKVDGRSELISRESFPGLKRIA